MTAIEPVHVYPRLIDFAQKQVLDSTKRFAKRFGMKPAQLIFETPKETGDRHEQLDEAAVRNTTRA
ncbi:hypothetical protein [Paraburkholderia youngii]|uniref:hypothetical protein n=1 Tax=Paraburkholderia youngii TaxID=2782701 RepID=UPI003D1ECEDC